MSRTATFQNIYSGKTWWSGESLSGWGSDMSRTYAIRQRLPWLLQLLGVHSLLDAGCGDLNWISQMPLGMVDYHGVDIVPEVVAAVEAAHAAPGRFFSVADICTDPLPECDAVLCREVLFHLCHDSAVAALRNMRASGATWLLATTYPHLPANDDIPDGGFRPTNLQAAPYDLPTPRLLLPEDGAFGPDQFNAGCLGLWPLQRSE